MRIYDEARRAVNAYEMLNSSNILVTTYAGAPDMWGTKPPLLIWLQAICMYLIGPTELAVRLPSALSGMGIVVLMVLFSKVVLRKVSIGVIASIILLTSKGFMESTHSVRTGDFDALLVFITFGYLITFFVYTEYRKNWMLYLTCAGIFLAVMAKSIMGLLFMPALLIYALWRRSLLEILRSKHFYFGAISCLIAVMSFYLARDYYNPGYINAVWENELHGRYNEGLEGHSYPYNYYFVNLWEDRFKDWLLFSVVGCLACLKYFGNLFYHGVVKRFAVFALLCALVFLCVIANSSTKLIWYDLPAFPFLALLAAIGWLLLLKTASRLSSRYIRLSSSRAMLVASVLTLLWLVPPYVRTVKFCMRPDPSKYTTVEAYGHYMEETNQDYNKYNVTSLYYRPNILFYTQVYNDRGYAISAVSPDQKLSTGDKIIICTKKEIARVKSTNKISILKQKGDCVTAIVE